MEQAWVYSVALLFAFSLHASSGMAEQSKDTLGSPRRAYRVGVIFPLTGRVSSAGTAIYHGFQLGLEQLAPEIRAQLLVANEDDGAESSRAISAYQKLKTGGLDVVVTAFSNSGNAIAPLAETHLITHLSIAIDEGVALNRMHTVQVFSKLGDLTPKMIEEIERRGYKRVAVINTAHEGNTAMRRTFQKAAGGKFELIDLGEVLPTETDFRTISAKLKQSPHDAVAVFLHPAHAGIFAEQIRKLGIKSPLFGFANLSDKKVIESARGGFDGAWYVEVKESEHFVKSYAASFPGHSRFCAVYGYDVALLLGEVVQRRIPPSGFRSFLKTLRNFSSGAGEISADENAGFTYPPAVYEIQGNSTRLLDYNGGTTGEQP